MSEPNENNGPETPMPPSTKRAIRPDELERVTGDDKDVWYDRIWSTVEEKDYMFVIAGGKFGQSSEATSRFHLPAEFPDGDLQVEPFEKLEGDCTHCRPHGDVAFWKFKPVACYPTGYRDFCSYCIYDFVEWWNAERRSRPGGRISDVE